MAEVTQSQQDILTILDKLKMLKEARKKRLAEVIPAPFLTKLDEVDAEFIPKIIELQDYARDLMRSYI